MKWNFFSKTEATTTDLDIHIKTYEFVRRRMEADIANLEDQVTQLHHKINHNTALSEKLMKQVDLLCHQISNTFKAEGLDEKAIKDAEAGRKRREYQNRWKAKKKAQEQAEKKKQERLAKNREYAKQYYLRKKAERMAAK